MAYIGNAPAPQNITSAGITDGTIVNVDIANNAAIAASKISGLSTVATSGAYPDLSSIPTAADILTSIKTVDGAASGLDADTLDGKHLATVESEYQTYADAAAAAVVDSAPGTLNTLNELALALGSDASFSTTVTNSIASKLPVTGGTMTGGLVVPSATVNGTLDIEEVYEKVNSSASTTGTLAYETNAYGVLLLTTAQTANRTINFTNVNANLAVGQSVTCAVIATQGSTAYYLNAYQVDASAVTPKWSGGTAPTAGNASGIDSYSFTIIKTADATFTVLASQTQFA